MHKPTSVDTLNKLGRERLSPHFFMREMLYSEVANFDGMPNIPDNPDLAILAGKELCNRLLEPLYASFGHVSIRSAYRSYEVNRFCCEQQKKGKKGYTCACDNAARHTWDSLEGDKFMGATACIVIPWFVEYLEKRPKMSWTAMAWWIHDHRHDLPYSEMRFFPVNAAFNIRWRGRREPRHPEPEPEPEHKIKSYMKPRLLTKPGMKKHCGDHSSEYPGFPELRLP